MSSVLFPFFQRKFFNICFWRNIFSNFWVKLIRFFFNKHIINKITKDPRRYSQVKNLKRICGLKFIHILLFEKSEPKAIRGRNDITYVKMTF